jgi:hypothetical protein
MACKVCNSENQQNFSVESIIVFPGVQRLELAPVYVCQKTLVCLDCGHGELDFTATELEKLRMGMEGSHPKVDFACEYSRLQ